MDYRIDYDRIDVADIMTQVKMKVAERLPVPEAPVAGLALPPPAPETPPAAPVVSPPARGWKGILKKTVRFLVRPYFPFLIPLYDGFKFRMNYEVNVRLDETATRLEKAREELIIRLDMERGDLLARLATTRETVKLLHNLSHNLVLELTKLKVEEEALKSKVRVLEKELETVGKREKAIEKKVFE
jgi:hypothetical protein